MRCVSLLCSSIAIAAHLLVVPITVAEEVEVTLVAGHAPVLRWVGHLTDTFIPAVDEALTGTGYSIDWNTQFAGTLAGVGQELETTARGLAETGLVLSVFDPSKLAEQNVSYYMPFSTVKTQIVLDVMQALHADDETFKTPWTRNGLTYLGGGVGTADYILMTATPVISFDDLDGLKIGVAGPSATWLSGTGAVAVSGNLTTYFTNIRAGVLDGVIVPENAALPTRLHEVAPHVLKVGFGAQYAGGMAANADWFAAQPEAVQQALRTGAATYSAAFAKELSSMAARALDDMAKEGATIREADTAFRRRWVAGMKNAAATWAASLDGDGAAVLKTYMEALRQAGETPLRDWDTE